MKKTILLFVFLSMMAMSGKTQVVFQENFNAFTTTSGFPTGWTRFNVDGLTVYSGYASWMGTEAWVAHQFSGVPFTTGAAWSTSWYASPGISNDWMFTPAITIPATGNIVLQFAAAAYNASYADGYEVRVMTAAPTAANLMTSTVILSIPAENPTVTLRSIDLHAYLGQTVYIAWRNNSNDKDILGVDDVVVKNIPDNDAFLTAITTPNFVTAGNIDIKGSIQNLGFTPLTSYDVTYTVDGGTASSAYSVTGINIATLGTTTFTHNVPASLVAGAHNVQVTISNVNHGIDTAVSNNVLSKVIHVPSQTLAKVALFEGFSSSTCAPCATFNTNTFNPWAATHDADMNFIKYQVNWPSPGDPYYIQQAGDRVDYYGVGGVPAMFCNGTEIVTSAAGLNAALAANNADFASFNISMTPGYTGHTVSIPVTVTPYVTWANLSLHVVVCERLTNGNVGNNGETAWHHVMMQMIPGSTGTSVNFTNGTPYTNTFTKDMTSTFVEQMWDLLAVVFIQDNDTKAILQSKSVSFPVGIDEHHMSDIRIYPNPATTYVGIKNALNAKVELYDMFGKLVKSDNKISDNYSLNVSDLSNGTYMLKVVSGEKIRSEKITIVR